MIGNRIQKLRKSRGLSLSELAEKAGVAKSYLSNVERNIQSNPSLQILEKIADVLNISLEGLIKDQGSMDSPLDEEWIALAREAQNSGITKEEFKDFLAYQKWKRDNSKSSLE